MGACATYDPECYGCQVRAKGIAVAAAATPNREPKGIPHVPDPAWERGQAGEFRRDGSFMPILAPGTLRPMGVHELQSQRAKVDEGLRVLRNAPTPERNST